MSGSKKFSEFTEVNSLEDGDMVVGFRTGAHNENIMISKENLNNQFETNEGARGTFTLSADGSSAAIGINAENPSAVNHSIVVEITVALAYLVGATVTNSTTGATGVITARDGDFYTLDNLTAGDWSSENVVTNGVLPGSLASAAQWVITMPVGKLKLGHFDSASNVYTDGNNFRFSASKGTGDVYLDSAHSTVYQKFAGASIYPSLMAQGSCIYITDKDGNGWDGYISRVGDDDFDITLFKQSSEVGLDITVQYYILTGVNEITS